MKRRWNQLLSNFKDVVTYCTCKTGACTFGRCAHAIAALYFLMVELPSNNHKIGNYATSLSKSDVITNLRPFKLQKLQKKNK